MKPAIKVEGQAALDPELELLLEHAQESLKVVLGRSEASVDADWTLIHDSNGRPVVVLKLTDRIREGPTVSNEFRPDDFRDADHVRDRLRQLFGDLLQSRLEQIGQDLKSILASEGIVL